MKTILVTGIGALIGQGIIQALNNLPDRQNIKLVGIDRNVDTHARFLCDHFIQKPRLNELSAEYIDFWTRLLSEEGIDLILPGIEDDVIFFNEHRQSPLGNFPALLNSRKTLSIGLDKYALFVFSTENNIPAIPSALASDSIALDNLNLLQKKTILKPRASNGSRGMFRFERIEELQSFLKNKSFDELNDLIVQPYIGSDSEEYTASVFGFGDGAYQGPIVFKRLLAKEGYTKYAKTVYPPNDIVTCIDIVAKYCTPVGPTNFQFRKHDNQFLLMEINPRFSSTTSLKAAFGFDEARMSFHFFFNGAKDFNLSLVEGEAWRYTSDFIKYL
ncbi:ATP-grasp domain-containing protein [Synechococcus sp. AH-707-M23]|nr:ATP-grasp domain-containing protein [Synechococcus sp. AH-707-M23]